MNNEYTMTRGSVLRIEDGQGLVVRVREGSLWLTQERDRRDRYLGAGDWFQLDRDGVAIAQATRRSTVTLIELYSTAKTRVPLGARLYRFWTGLFAPHARPTTASL